MTILLFRSPAVSPSEAIPCRVDPDCWTEAGDDPGLKALCRGCPRRARCAREALDMPGASGVWAGIFIPPDDGVSRRHDRSRAHAYAMTRLRVIATLDVRS
jgi:WhiB family redox-sensing transcriptional regulator